MVGLAWQLSIYRGPQSQTGESVKALIRPGSVARLKLATQKLLGTKMDRWRL